MYHGLDNTDVGSDKHVVTFGARITLRLADTDQRQLKWKIIVSTMIGDSRPSTPFMGHLSAASV